MTEQVWPDEKKTATVSDDSRDDNPQVHSNSINYHGELTFSGQATWPNSRGTQPRRAVSGAQDALPEGGGEYNIRFVTGLEPDHSQNLPKICPESARNPSRAIRKLSHAGLASPRYLSRHLTPI
ncbi:hypothetical protein RRG08_045440 [Elysia crispata]|uniref:Uncharacterized protein n=1 Tax=Elysia crispata TaxID=231223 RepID=A0AAE1E6K1_9GAST|nr:hypothetical protein RRG08_045440 [Elysia crispata]